MLRPIQNPYSGLGQAVMGEAVFHQPIGTGFHFDISRNETLPRAQNGFLHSGRRRYGRPEILILPRVTRPLDEGATVSIVSRTGALVGKLRTDVQRTLIHSIMFTDKLGSPGTCTLKLSKLPDFPILPFSIITISVANSKFNWYAGEILYPSRSGSVSKKKLFEFKARGLKHYLNHWKGEGIYQAGQDIGQIVKTIAMTEIEGRGAIKYNESKINLSTEILNVQNIDIAKHTLSKIFDTFAEMTGSVWGVDADREFFFLPKNQKVIKSYFVGYHVQNFITSENQKDVKNVITVQRQEGKGSGGVGWKVGGVFNDETSVKKYGRKELNYQVPGFFSEEDCENIGRSLLKNLSEPKTGGRLTDFPIKSTESFFKRGIYRFVMPFASYSLNYSEVDRVEDWQKKCSGDLALTHDSQTFVYANGSLKLTFSNAEGDQIYLEKPFSLGKITKIQFYIQANQTGSFLSFGFGLNSIDERSFKIDIAVSNQFIPIEFDLSDLDIREIRVLGFFVNSSAKLTGCDTA